MGATYRPGTVATWSTVIPPVVVDENNPHCQKSGVCWGVTRYPFSNLGRMKGSVGASVQELIGVATSVREVIWKSDD